MTSPEHGNLEPHLPLHTEADSGPESPERRGFLVRASLWLSAAAAGLMGLPVLGYLLAPLFSGTRRQWIDLGTLDQFPIGQVKLANFQDLSPREWAGLTSATAVYVRHAEESVFDVFAVNCTHLGCPVSWLPGAQLFLCPCHGGAYYRDGSVAAGPPQHPLYEYQWRIQGDHLQVLTQPLPPATPWEPPRFTRRSE